MKTHQKTTDNPIQLEFDSLQIAQLICPVMASFGAICFFLAGKFYVKDKQAVALVIQASDEECYKMANINDGSICLQPFER